MPMALVRALTLRMIGTALILTAGTSSIPAQTLDVYFLYSDRAASGARWIGSLTDHASYLAKGVEGTFEQEYDIAINVVPTAVRFSGYFDECEVGSARNRCVLRKLKRLYAPLDPVYCDELNNTETLNKYDLIYAVVDTNEPPSIIAVPWDHDPRDSACRSFYGMVPAGSDPSDLARAIRYNATAVRHSDPWDKRNSVLLQKRLYCIGSYARIRRERFTRSEAARCEEDPPKLSCLPGYVEPVRFAVVYAKPRDFFYSDCAKLSHAPFHVGDNAELFWFFDPQNPEIMVKVLAAGCEHNGRIWLFAAPTTDLYYMVIADNVHAAPERFYRWRRRSTIIADTETIPCAAGGSQDASYDDAGRFTLPNAEVDGPQAYEQASLAKRRT